MSVTSRDLAIGAASGFLAGFAMHYAADRTIRQLRDRGNTGYGIPQGILFRWVSSPHYLGEIIQWTGWAVLTWSAAGTAFALFTFCNLAPRALSNHRWYRERFPDYPAEPQNEAEVAIKARYAKVLGSAV